MTILARSGTRTPPSGNRRPHRQYPRATPVAFLLPFFALFCALTIAPIVYAAWHSLFRAERSGLGLSGSETVFAGLDNYLAVLTDPAFYGAIRNVLIYSVMHVTALILGALAIALLLDSSLTVAKRFHLPIVFLPYAVPSVVATLLWGFMYEPTLNPILNWLADHGLGIDLLSSGLVLPAIANITQWLFLGYATVITYTSLQSIPRELYEAAELDGAGSWQVVRYIKVPMLRPTLVMLTVFTLIGSSQLINEPQILQSRSTVIGNNFTPNLMAYSETFVRGNSHMAAAIAVVIALTTAAASFAFLRLVQGRSTS